MKCRIPANSHALCVSLTPAGWNFDLTPAHACGPISHAWLKNVSCCPLAWHNFQKYVNSDPCKKWINDNNFLEISDFWSEKHWKRARIYTRPKTSEDLRRLRKTSDFFGNLRKLSCRLKKTQHSQDKNLTLISWKKLAGIMSNSVRLINVVFFFTHFLFEDKTNWGGNCNICVCNNRAGRWTWQHEGWWAFSLPLLWFKVPITPKIVFHLVKSLYWIRKNIAKIFAFGWNLNFLWIFWVSILCTTTEQTGEWA